MKPEDYLTQGLLLPELKLHFVLKISQTHRRLILIKERKGAVCTRCANFSSVLYDKRVVKLKDVHLMNSFSTLEVHKKRYYCKPCKRPFTEPLPGVLPRSRCTQRFKKAIYEACENYADLKKVCHHFRSSPGFVYASYYEVLDLKSRKHHRYPFPKVIGIDEHHFGRKKGLGKKEFVTMLVDHSHRRLREVIQGRTHQSLENALNEIPGKENVKLVTLDMSDSYKSFCRSYFPNAELVADRFHVQRLIHPYLNQSRIEVTGDKRKNPVRTLMNKNRLRLKYYERSALDYWLEAHPKIKEIYGFKEQIVRFYNIKGYHRAVRAFDLLIEALKSSQIQELKTLRNTFMKWRTEILNYFKYRITNARVEGFNNVAKVIKRRAYGYRSFRNYRLRLLNACS